MENVFLNSSERNNSKTYYYVRLVSEHQIGLVVHNEKYKKELIRKYIGLQRGWEVIPIYNIQNGLDVWTIKDRLKRKTLKGLINDNEIVWDIMMESKNILNFKEIIYSKWLNDDEIREIILDDMSQRKYMYE